MDLGLKGKIALVTGASRGLGYATAHLLSQEGAVVVINSRNAASLSAAAQKITQSTGQSVIPISGDMTDPDLCHQLIDQITHQLGALDILIANAGGPPAGSFESFDDLAWQKAFDLVCLSYVRLIRQALPLLKKSSSASILTITSSSTKQPIPNLVLSNSIRLATIGLTKTLALELGAAGIRVNSILPGWTDTERVQDLMKNRASANGTRIEDELKKQANESPLGRIAQPEEFARAAVFLASPAASYITGTMLSIDGGMYKGTF